MERFFFPRRRLLRILFFPVFHFFFLVVDGTPAGETVDSAPSGSGPFKCLFGLFHSDGRLLSSLQIQSRPNFETQWIPARTSHFHLLSVSSIPTGLSLSPPTRQASRGFSALDPLIPYPVFLDHISPPSYWMKRRESPNSFFFFPFLSFDFWCP